MNKKALVTGGTRGIGRGVVECLLDAGYDVIATGISDEEAAQAKPHENLTNIALNVRDNAAIKTLVSGLDRLDALVNCAGTLRRGEEYDIEVFEQVIDINLTGTMRMCVACHPLLVKSGGAIVNTASMLSYFGGPMVPAYTASKGGIAQLTKALAVHWASDNIRVNAVAPGWIETEMTQGIRKDKPREDAIIGRTPQGKWGQPKDIGNAVKMLLSSDADFITGTILPVDGGYSAV